MGKGSTRRPVRWPNAKSCSCPLTADHCAPALTDLWFVTRAFAARVYTDLLTVQTRALGAEHRDTLSTSMQLAGASLNQGRNAEAEGTYRRILEVQTRVLGRAPTSRVRDEFKAALVQVAFHDVLQHSIVN